GPGRDRGQGAIADGGDRHQTGAHRLAIDMDGAGAAKPGAAAELAAFQIKLVAQHPQKRHVAVDFYTPLYAVDVDRIGHGFAPHIQATISNGAALFRRSRESEILMMLGGVPSVEHQLQHVKTMPQRIGAETALPAAFAGEIVATAAGDKLGIS